jgi:hypothetical protein
MRPHPDDSRSAMASYRADLVDRYWAYQQRCFPDVRATLERPLAPDGRPPVLRIDQAWRNVITAPDAGQQEIDRLLALMPGRHRWYRSMNSSQALTHSVFGNLALYQHLPALAGLYDDDGLPLFGRAPLTAGDLALEHRVDHLGEPSATGLDVYLPGEYQIAVECKFTEGQVGSCSRPRLTPGDSSYGRQYCDGNYSRAEGGSRTAGDSQAEGGSRTEGRSRTAPTGTAGAGTDPAGERCPLTAIGVRYWRHVPALFNWRNDVDHTPCPLNRNYQLVRTLLAVGVRPDGTIGLDDGHVVLVYDERNPAFQEGGEGLASYRETRAALHNPAMLRRCSWQRLIHHLRDNQVLPWLTDHLALKYGF